MYVCCNVSVITGNSLGVEVTCYSLKEAHKEGNVSECVIFSGTEGMC